MLFDCGSIPQYHKHMHVTSNTSATWMYMSQYQDILQGTTFINNSMVDPVGKQNQGNVVLPWLSQQVT